MLLMCMYRTVIKIHIMFFDKKIEDKMHNIKQQAKLI